MRAKTEFRTPAEKNMSAEDRARFWSAIDSLSPAELLRLKLYAAWRIRILGHLAAGREAADLLHEAIAATVDDRRPWKGNGVPLMAHLRGAMRSISSGWSEKGVLGRRRRVTAPDEITA